MQKALQSWYIINTRSPFKLTMLLTMAMMMMMVMMPLVAVRWCR